MKSLGLGCYALALGGAALLAGCRGTQPPIGVPGEAMSRPFTHSKAQTTGQDLLYVSDGVHTVFVYTYPQGSKVGTLMPSSGAGGLCSDSAGNVFVTGSLGSENGRVLEYAHGGTTPIATLSDTGIASACSVDPTTGNLAVANWTDPTNPYGPELGDVAVYNGASGAPTMYYSPNQRFSFCGYDNIGNLYLTAPSARDPYKFNLFRLMNGKYAKINLTKTIYNDPSVQWDGSYITVTSTKSRGGPLSIYRLSISGKKATVVGTTVLRNRKNRHDGQLWIGGGSAVGIDFKGYRNVSFWSYPNGGDPTHTIKKVGVERRNALYGLTVSVAGSR